MGVSMKTEDIAFGQGAYYVGTGLWPLLNIRSFEAVTGPKTDHWLVKTVGVLVSIIGAVLMHAARHRRVEREATLLAVGSAAGLAIIDTVYASRRRISRIYLLDAMVETLLLLLYGVRRALPRRRHAATDGIRVAW